MRKLTRAEEKDYIRGIIEGKYPFLGNGSTRATYELDDDKVIKLTVDNNYIGQHDTEVELFKREGSKYLAEIYEYGEQIIIAEKVITAEEESWNDLQYYLEENAGEDFDLDEGTLECISNIWGIGPTFLEKLKNEINPFNEYEDVVNFLERYDISDDGGQFGYAKDGRLVAYDYGLDRNSDDMLVGDLYDVFDSSDFDYIAEFKKEFLEG